MGDATGLSLDSLATHPYLSPNSARFAAYWTSLPKDQLVPRRCCFDPTAQVEILRTYVILEIVSADHIRFRLVGSAEVERYGREVTGLNYLDFVDQARRARAARALLLMAETPCGMLAEIHSTTLSGRHSVNEALGFPMRDREGRVSLLYFQSNTMTDDDEDDAPERRGVIRHDRVSQRLFIDIGAGLPADFKD